MNFRRGDHHSSFVRVVDFWPRFGSKLGQRFDCACTRYELTHSYRARDPRSHDHQQFWCQPVKSHPGASMPQEVGARPGRATMILGRIAAHTSIRATRLPATPGRLTAPT
jgi:hypothetical protein